VFSELISGTELIQISFVYESSDIFVVSIYIRILSHVKLRI